jgi:Ca-activated chloride channel homolog
MPSLPSLPSLPSIPPMTYEWPILLWSLALVPIFLLLYVLAQYRRRTYALRFTNLALLRDVVGRRPGLRRHIPPLLFLLGVGALLFSLARPSAVIAIPRDQSDVMLVVDTSGSMTATDLRPSRMVAARLAAEKFVQALPPNTRVGLVEFSTRARLASPLTRDRAVVLSAIKGLEADGGTAIGDGLALALDVFRREAVQVSASTSGAAPSTSENTPGTVVLLSDGASSAGQPPQQAATRATEAGVVVHTVGIGERNSGARVGGRTPAELDERTLQGIAQATGGEYFYAAQAGDLERIYTSIGSRVSWTEERTEVTALASALGTFLLIVAGLFSLRWLHGLP